MQGLGTEEHKGKSPSGGQGFKFMPPRMNPTVYKTWSGPHSESESQDTYYLPHLTEGKIKAPKQSGTSIP